MRSMPPLPYASSTSIRAYRLRAIKREYPRTSNSRPSRSSRATFSSSRSSPRTRSVLPPTKRSTTDQLLAEAWSKGLASTCTSAAWRVTKVVPRCERAVNATVAGWSPSFAVNGYAKAGRTRSGVALAVATVDAIAAKATAVAARPSTRNMVPPLRRAGQPRCSLRVGAAGVHACRQISLNCLLVSSGVITGSSRTRQAASATPPLSLRSRPPVLFRPPNRRIRRFPVSRG